MVATADFTTERITYEEAAVIVGVKPQTLRKWVSLGKYDFPMPVEIGALRYFIRSEVDAWLDRRLKRSRR